MDPQNRLSTAMSFQRKPRRPRKEIPRTLSLEAKLAMSQVQEENELSSQNNPTVPYDCERSPRTVESPTTACISEEQTNIPRGTFNEVYERLDILRLDGDITLSSETSRLSPSKRCIGGGKLFNAMEVVETVIFGQEICDQEIEDIGKEDTARLISLEKCRVWFDAQKHHFAMSPALHPSQNQFTSSACL